MNKQEVIKKLREAGLNGKQIKVATQFDKGYNNGIAYALNLVDKLDEPEKPIVPQFVADWHEENKNDFENSLAILIRDYFKGEIEDDNLLFWFGYDLNKDQPIKTLVNIHQFGYEVEKEKLYTARLEVVTQKEYAFLNKEYSSGNIFIYDLRVPGDKYQVYFTQKELEELNVWDSPAFEVEEVEK